MVVSNNNFILLCTVSLSMDGKSKMVGFILFISLVLTALAESPPVDDSADCVKPKHPLCPKNEERRCQNPCPPETCVTLYAAFLCIQNQTCVDGCYCKQGFLRVGQKGPCVPRDQCNPLECVNDPNAQKGCGDRCGKTCADYKTNPICPKRPCTKNGCECKEGYIYDKNLSLCVKPKDCTKPCKANERYSTCLLSECVPETCDDVGKSLACPAIAAVPCPGGCICDYGYVKDKDGNCIDAKTCPSCGDDPNAQAGCGNPCGKTCASLNSNKSELICPQYCESYGCDCKEGYLLNTDVKPPRCVLVKDCPKPPNKCGKNEEFYCGPSCPNSEASCSNPNPPTCINKRCELKCFCKKGFVRDSNNACIPANKCPKLCTKPHERYSNCLLGDCIPKTCDDLGKPLPCPDIAPPCAGGCICEEGYVRDKDGNCIDAKTCPSCGGDPNAVSGCGNPCGRTCASLRTNIRNKRDISAVACATYCEVNGCDCKKGYILNTDVNPPRCVLPEDCNKPARQCTKPNEKYIDCLPGQCKPKTCDELVRPAPCPRVIPPCPGGCICVDGYVRNKAGDCIKKEDCPINCTKPHERYIDCLPGQCGPKTCDDLGRSISCPSIVGPCPGGCICEEGYLRDSEGNCIKLEKCPAKPCGGNQTWMSPCIAPCPNQRCPRDDKPPPPCDEIKPCYPGCQCKLNYLRNSTGNCILAPDCPPVNCTRKNEIWDGCPACLAEDCDDVDRQPKTCETLIWLCSPRCVCKKGHFRNKDGVCVPASQCPARQCTKPNEKYIDCLPGQCKPKTCDELVRPAPCPRVIPPCPGGCICVDGYVRNKAGDCIKEEDCQTDDSLVPGAKPVENVPRRCPANEVLKSRVACPPDSCDMLYLSVLCTANQTESVVCTCKDGYMRTNSTATGVCIPQDRCLPPECADDPNAKRGCGNRCGKTCADYNDTSKVCNKNVCKLFGCDCQDGFVYDTNTNRCVKPKQCTKQCTKPHERYSTCLLGECVPKTCAQLGYPISCPRIASPCEGGCICEEGYVRDSNGDCIEKNKCPSCGGDPNAVSGCGNPCGETCDDLNKNKSELVCPQYCEYNGCDCKPGHLLLNADNPDSKKCVPEKECPKPKQCKGPHEKYIDCPAGQCNPKTCNDLITPPGCPRIKPPCPGGCVCEDGYLRNSKGICIKKEQCPSVQCKKPHERYSNCLLGNCVPKTCKDVGYPVACPDIIGPCAGGCICEEGFVRDCNGDCIDMKKCPSCGGDPNAVSGCGNPCGKTCASLYANNSDLVCPQYCEYNGCDCKPGYLLLESNNTDSSKCVPERECPKPPKCKGPHEKYIDCPAGQCNAKTCKDLITLPPCPRVLPPCPGGCVCEEGYLRDSNGICIIKEQCPQACKANETYVSCNVSCPDKYCPKDDQPQPVCDPPRDCPPGCTCKINYRYDKYGNCILASECPPVNCTGQNTEWDPCPSDCLSEQCEDADSPPAVCNTLLLNCQPRCVCKKGHFKNKDGLCVPAKECPSVCKDPNASWTDCKDACPATCQNTRPACVNKMCSAGCQCNDGYVLSKIGGKCVKIEECPDYADCGTNQTFVSCTFKCPQVECPMSDQIILCKPPRDCPGGCGCKPYYRYNATGDCIKASDCPSVECTGANQVWTSCQRISDWERCEDRYNSPPFNPGDPDDCTPKCVCEEGYWRNDANECVTEHECPPLNW